jgi:hypothetical protein
LRIRPDQAFPEFKNYILKLHLVQRTYLADLTTIGELGPMLRLENISAKIFFVKNGDSDTESCSG